MKKSVRLTWWAYWMLGGIFLVGSGWAQGVNAQTIGSVGVEPLAVQEVSFYSASVARDMRFEIILPKDYQASGKRYPVLYMLHGLTSNYKSWARMGVPGYLNQFDMIAVIPDAGNSWYVNWAESEEGQKNNFDDYISQDLIKYVDGHYRTIARREGRAIMGLSMGGYGAIMLGLRHPDLYCSIGSHSGALSYAATIYRALEAGREPFGMMARLMEGERANRITVDIEGFGTMRERTPKGKMFVTLEDAAAYDPFQLVLKVDSEQVPHIYLDCGTEDGLIKSAQSFMKLLQENKIPFTYAQSSGGHAASYWLREVEHSMSVQYAIIQRNLRQADRSTEKVKEVELK